MVRASLAARGVTIVDFPLPSDATPPVAAGLELAAAAAATAVSRELYQRGMLSAAWEVGPAMAAVAIEGGHIQRALVRRRPRAEGGSGGGDGPAAAAAVGGPAGVGGSSSGPGERSGCCAVGTGGVISREEEREALRVMRRLSGSEGVRVRRGGGGVFPWSAGGESCIEVLLPAAGLDPPASA